MADKIQKSIGLEAELWAWIQTQADSENRSLANWIETKLEDLQRQAEQNPSKNQTR